MAATTSIDVLITVKDLVAVRQRSLELALDNIDSGPWTNILGVAKRFENYILEGKTDDDR